MEVGRVNRLEASEFFPAGKGANTARVLLGLGEKVLLLSYGGGDNGERFRRAITAEGIPYRYVRTRGETRTCTTILEAQDLTTELIEPAATLQENAQAVSWFYPERGLSVLIDEVSREVLEYQAPRDFVMPQGVTPNPARP